MWPFSRKDRPKQFLSLDGESSFFQSTVQRCDDPLFDDRMIVVAANDHRFLVAENLAEISKSADIVLEPMPRNSAAAIIAGCLMAKARDPEAIVIVLAADHRVDDREAFVQTVSKAVDAANDGKLVTFGIKPDRPATGYGYVKVNDTENTAGTSCYPVLQFVEKPDKETAQAYVKDGYFWNSGNFMFKASVFLEEARHLIPDVFECVQKAFADQKQDLDFVRLGSQAFGEARSVSVDYAIMEKTERAVMVPALHDWSDIGTWHSVWENLPKSKAENAAVGDAVVLDGSGNLVHSPDRLATLIGVDDLVVVSTSDALLVSRKDSSESIKHIVDHLQEKGRREATCSRKEYRPWGNYDVIDAGEGYKVKRIEIKPGGVLSLQRHEHRAEHWVLVSGVVEVTLCADVRTLEPNQSLYIDRGVVHRLANRGEKLAVLIEVQTGDYLGEDDIERLEDEYNRID